MYINRQVRAYTHICVYAGTRMNMCDDDDKNASLCNICCFSYKDKDMFTLSACLTHKYCKNCKIYAFFMIKYNVSAVTHDIRVDLCVFQNGAFW